MRKTLFAALLVLGACTSNGDATRPEEGAGPERLAQKPFLAHMDALETRFLPGGSFAPGVEAIWAPVHSSTNATLYFVALRTKLPRYVCDHEETFFIVKGAGTLDLAGKPRPIEGGSVVRIPPGYAHGFTPRREEPLVALLVVAPTVEGEIGRPQETDDPAAAGIIYCEDAYSEKHLPLLEPAPRPDAKKRFLDDSKYSTLQIAAVGRCRIPDHKHPHRDETVIIFAQEGFGFLRVDSTENPVQSIEIAHIPAGAVHAFEHKANGHSRAISIFTPGRYDGTDVELVKNDAELKRPQGYKQTDYAGDWADPGYHSVPGDRRQPKPQRDEEIRGLGNPAQPR